MKKKHDEKYSHKDCTSDPLDKNFKNYVARCEELEEERESIMKKYKR